MPYYTGTVASTAAVKTLIETQCVANGWSLSGGWLSKGINHVAITAPDSNYVYITGANSSDGLTEPAGFYRTTWIDGVYWPVTYHLFIHANPDLVACVLNYNTFDIQVIMFGNLVKINDSAFVGGNWFYASGDTSAGIPPAGSSTKNIDLSQLIKFNGYQLVMDHPGNFDTSSHAIPFCSSADNATERHPLHCKIDSEIWGSVSKRVTYTDGTLTALYRSPNLWNNQTHLVPMNLQFPMADGLFGYLGYFEHIRLCRVTNYEIGDLITISPDVWKVFPWRYKDALYPNGGNPDKSRNSGTIGFAVRYDV